MRWLAECSEAALDEAIRAVAPELAGCRIDLRERVGAEDPLWWSSSAVLDDRLVAKFAWSRPAAQRRAHEIAVVAALAGELAVPFLPEVVAASVDPVLLITSRVAGTSLFEVVDSIDRDDAGRQLAAFLAALHRPATGEYVRREVGELPVPRPPAATSELRDRFGRWVRDDQHETVVRWCDWADRVLADRRPEVLVHGDLHGDNQVWRDGELRAVVDFETVGFAEAEYELRAFPGTGPGIELLTSTLKHYRRATGLELSVDRVMAWHLRNALGDVLWRSEAGIALPDHRTPSEWVDDLGIRLERAGRSL